MCENGATKNFVQTENPELLENPEDMGDFATKRSMGEVNLAET